MILGLTHVGLTVKEMDRSLEYYRQNLGFEVLSDAPRKGEAAEKITGVRGIHTRTVYLVEVPHKHLELFQFYNPQPAPAECGTDIRVGISYAVLVRHRLEISSEFQLPLVDERWSFLDRRNENGPFPRHRIITMQDPDGLFLRIVESGNGEGETTEVSGDRSLYPALIVEKLETSIEFYQKTLGLEIIDQGTDDPKSVGSLVGETRGAIRWVLLKASTGLCMKLVQPLDCKILPAHPWRMERIGFTHVAFAVEDIEGYYFDLLERGTNFISAPEGLAVGPHKGGKCVYLKSPEGIALEFLDSPLTREQFVSE